MNSTCDSRGASTPRRADHTAPTRPYPSQADEALRQVTTPTKRTAASRRGHAQQPREATR